MPLEITAITKLRHAALFELITRLGGRHAAAEQVGIGVQTFDKWVKLRQCFPPRPGGSIWNECLWTSVKGNLESLTGQTIDELFPESLRKAVKLQTFISNVEQTVEVSDDALLAYSEHTQERLRLSDPIESAERSELKSRLLTVLFLIPFREREILKQRFGLEDGKGHTLEEVGKEFGVTRETIRQIEARAIRKLQQPKRAKYLAGFLD